MKEAPGWAMVNERWKKIGSDGKAVKEKKQEEEDDGERAPTGALRKWMQEPPSEQDEQTPADMANTAMFDSIGSADTGESRPSGSAEMFAGVDSADTEGGGAQA